MYGVSIRKNRTNLCIHQKKKKTYVYNYIYHVYRNRYRILMRNVQMLQKVEKSASLTILLLLFVLGVSIGSNRLIVDNLGRFGWQAAVLASLSITGSMLASLMVFHLFFKKGEKR